MQIAIKEKETRRIASRNRTEVEVACGPFTSSGATHTTNGVMRNFSKNGSYIETSREFKLGTILYLRIVRYPPRSLLVATEELPRSICLAEVIWRQEMAGKNTIQYGLGLRHFD